jgi:xylulokinase
MSEKHYFLGIDLGTSAVKMILIDEHKEVLARQTVEYAVSSPVFGWREIDPVVWFDCTIKGLAEIFAQWDPQNVDAIGITGQMHTLVMMDENGESLHPALMWDDIRMKDLLPDLRRIIAQQPDCVYIAKNISTGSPAASLYWMRHFEPGNFTRIKKFLIAPDYLVYRLTGVYGTDYCGASTSCLYDIQNRRWSPFMRDLLEIDDDVYPEVRGSGVVAGTVTAEIARRFSLREDVKVLTGTGDNPATAISTGCLGQGYPVISLGTSGVLMMKTAQPEQDAKGKVILFSSDGQNFSYLVQGVLQSNGGSFEWWIHTILDIDDFSLVDMLLRVYQVQKNDLLFFPHLMGEKTLFADPDIRGAFICLNTLTSRADMIYAVIEGLCYGYRELTENMRFDLCKCASIRIVGGGSQSCIQAQTLANVLNVAVEQMDGFVNPAFGIALLAAHSCGSIRLFAQETNNTNLVKKIFKPQEEMVKICDEKYGRYLKIYPALKSIYGH